MVSQKVRIGIRNFTSVAEADRYYHAILHRLEPGDEVPFKEAKEVLALSLFDGSVNKYPGKKYCNVASVCVIATRFKRRVFCIRLVSGKTVPLSLARMFAVVRKNFRKIHKKVTKKQKLDTYENHLTQFRRACRKLIHESDETPRIAGLEAHHANPGGFAFIINSFIVLYNLDSHQKIADNGNIIDNTLKEEFIKFHRKSVMWEMIDHNSHMLIHKET